MVSDIVEDSVVVPSTVSSDTVRVSDAVPRGRTIIVPNGKFCSYRTMIGRNWENWIYKRRLSGGWVHQRMKLWVTFFCHEKLGWRGIPKEIVELIAWEYKKMFYIDSFPTRPHDPIVKYSGKLPKFEWGRVTSYRRVKNNGRPSVFKKRIPEYRLFKSKYGKGERTPIRWVHWVCHEKLGWKTIPDEIVGLITSYCVVDLSTKCWSDKMRDCERWWNGL